MWLNGLKCSAPMRTLPPHSFEKWLPTTAPRYDCTTELLSNATNT